MEIQYKLPDSINIAEAFFNIGKIYYFKGKFDFSQENYLRCKTIFENHENNYKLAEVRYQLVKLFYNMLTILT